MSLITNSVWRVADIDREKVKEFSKSLGIKPIVAQILISRGIKTLREAEEFLNPDMITCPSPFLLKGMSECVRRIRRAVANNEKILVFGDRDVDGITSVSIIMRTLKMLGAKNVFWYIPTTEGYGLNLETIERFKKEQDISLIITVDCGISNSHEIAAAKDMGIDTIVTDHHEPPPPEKLPLSAVAIINPKLPESRYPTRELAGCAVAFKVSHALLFSYNPYYDEELVALDIETTGLHPRYSEICEIGAVITKNGEILDTFQTLVKTKKSIPPEVSAIHGITDQMCENAPSIKEALERLEKFIGTRRLLIHNAPFDMSFLRHAFKKELGHALSNDYIDTLQMSRLHFPFKSHALTSLISDLKINVSEHHRALADATGCAYVFWRLQEMTDVRIRYFLEDHLDLVSIGTLADIMPLIGENRVLVKRGLELLATTRKVGVKEILDGALKERNTLTLTSKYVSWNITPLLNAAGRMGKADVACRLLMATRPEEAHDLYDEVVRLNMDRKELQEINVSKFFNCLNEQCDVEKDAVLVVSSDEVEHGVTGIVASHIVRKFKKPAILLVIKDGIAQGAGRSWGGFNILSAIEKASALLLKYGGHKSAIGLSLKSENIQEFRQLINEISQQELSKLIPEEEVISVDACVTLKDINPDFLKQIEQLEPFGPENPPPLFWIKNLTVKSASRMGADDEHLKVKFFSKDSPAHQINGVGWGMGDIYEDIQRWQDVDVVGHIESHLWQDKEYMQLQIIDVKKSDGN